MSRRHVKLTGQADNVGWETSDVRGEREDQYRSRKRPGPKPWKNKLRTGRKHRIPYRRPESCSPEMEQTSSSSGRQSSDRRRKSYVPSIKMTKNQNHLIWLVGLVPHLWNQKNPFFNYQVMRRNTWEAIAKVLDMDANECREHWIYLRARYDREARKLTRLVSHTIEHEFQQLMDTELIFLKSRDEDVGIVENSQFCETLDLESMMERFPHSTAVLDCYRRFKSIQERSAAQSSVPGRTTSTTQMSVPGSIRPSTSSFNPGLPGTASSPFLQTRASTSSDTRSSVVQPPQDPSPGTTTLPTPMVAVSHSALSSLPNQNQGLPDTASHALLQTRSSTQLDARSSVPGDPRDQTPGTMTFTSPMVLVTLDSLVPSSLTRNQGLPDTASPALPQARSSPQSDTQISVLRDSRNPSPGNTTSPTSRDAPICIIESYGSLNQGSPDETFRSDAEKKFLDVFAECSPQFDLPLKHDIASEFYRFYSKMSREQSHAWEKALFGSN